MIRVEAYKAQTGLTQCYNCQQFGHCGQTDVGATISIETARKKIIRSPLRLAVTVNWLRERSHIPPTTEAAKKQRRISKKRKRRSLRVGNQQAEFSLQD